MKEIQKENMCYIFNFKKNFLISQAFQDQRSIGLKMSYNGIISLTAAYENILDETYIPKT